MKTDTAKKRAGLRRNGDPALAVATDPVEQLQAWRDDWAEAGETDPSTVVLATVDDRCRPSARLMKLLTAGPDLVFATDARSRKGRDLSGRPAVALLFDWTLLARQARVEGDVETLGPADADADALFATLPLPAQLLAHWSEQSSAVASRSVLELARRSAELQLTGQVPRPPDWTVYRVVPLAIELWQERADQIHDRIRFERPAPDEPWSCARLAP